MWANPLIIAHHGHWNVENSAKNSIDALVRAQQLGVYGSQFDVWMTSDGVLVVNHDDVIEGFKIEDTPYEKIKEIRLKNGERLPLLEDFLNQGKKDKKTKLILELKPHSTKEKEDKAVATIVEMVKNIGVKNQTEYISHSLNICIEFVRLSPKTPVGYLSGNIPPHELKALKINIIDYNLSVLRRNPHWIQEAKKIKMKVNVWTLIKEEDIIEMINAGVDFLTTDNPVLCKELIKNHKSTNKKNFIFF